MTTENEMYGTGWIRCDSCGVTKPPALLFKPLRNPDGSAAAESGSHCLDTAACARGKAHVEHERDAFQRTHLAPVAKP